jgi:hypothetical protein
MKRTLLAALAVAMLIVPGNALAVEDELGSSLATAYGQIADAIIAVREAENAMVGTMLLHYYQSAKHNLEMVAGADEAERQAYLEAAAAHITSLANEGDKEVQAIIQRLLKAGHHHHTDGYTREDYMYIDSVEKKTLIGLAGKVARMDGSDESEVQGALDELTRLYQSAVEPD